MRKDEGGDMIAETIYKKVRTFVQSGRIPKRMAGTALAQLANKLGLANSTLRYMLKQLGEDFHILKDER